MSQRRANGEGSIFRRKDGRWSGQAYVLLPSGGRSRRVVYGKTRAEVHQKVTALVRQSHQGVVAPNGQIKLGDYLHEWLEDTARRHLRPRTFQNYELMVRLHLVPTLGQRRLDRITAADVRGLLNAKSDSGLSASTVKHIHAVLRVALEQAVRDDILVRNVARLVKSPALDAEPVEPLDVDEARRLLAVSKDDRLHALWAAALSIGLRKGEALGLRWEDVDFEEGRVRVVQQLQRIDGSLRLDPPKTRGSRRTIPVPPVCIDALLSHRVRQKEERAALGEYWKESGLVFTTQFGTPIDPRNVNRWFDALCKRAGVPRVRVHDLRHTCASLLLAQGVHPRVVMEILGHSQISMTMNTYSHVLPGVQEEAAKRMQDLLGEDLTDDDRC